MAETSEYGGWETQGERADAALFGVANRHHMASDDRGVLCLCGERAGTRRKFTEHVIDQTLKALAQAQRGRPAPTRHDAECEADWGAEGQESPCRCAERAASVCVCVGEHRTEPCRWEPRS